MTSAADLHTPEAAGESTQSPGFAWYVNLAPGHAAIGAAHLSQKHFFGLKHGGILHPGQVRRAPVCEVSICH